ncbi:MAG TPA: FtsX-like permease family protein [Streptosporangiaceae bacterium]|nr:FtsX-like permease family protein [Streptosporangiaceae bacterium]
MSRVWLVGRLAIRDLRHNLPHALLLLVAITVAMATLTLGLILHGVTARPYWQTRVATNGPDVVASSVGFAGPAGISAAALGRFDALAHAPGVTAHSGPYPVAWPVLRFGRVTADVMAEGRSPARAAVDQPDVVQGSWVRPGGVVVEREFADALGVHVGDRISLAGRRFRVVGIAVTAAVPVYSQVCFYGGCSGPPGARPSFDTGLVWLTEAVARSLGTAANPVTYYLNLRLAYPASAPAFVRAHQPPPGTGPLALTAWRSLRDAAATVVVQEQQVLLPASWLLGLLAMASVAVLAGGRMAAGDRRVGLLKAVGGTPALAAAVLLAEYLVIALGAAAAGLLTGRLVAPLLASPGASLVGGPGAVHLGGLTVLLVTAAAIAIAGVSTVVPAVRAARISAVAALAEVVRPPGRQDWLIRLSARLPVALLLGMRLATRRLRRPLLSCVSFAITGSAIVAVLIFHASVRGHAGQSGPEGPGDAQVSQLLLMLTVVFVLLAAVNVLAITWATVLDTRRFSAIVRSLGATRRQTTAGLTAAQLLPAFAGLLLAIPAGKQLYAAVQNGGPQASPSGWWLLVMVTGTLLAVAGLTAIPARIGARQPIAAVLTEA